MGQRVGQGQPWYTNEARLLKPTFRRAFGFLGNRLEREKEVRVLISNGQISDRVQEGAGKQLSVLWVSDSHSQFAGIGRRDERLGDQGSEFVLANRPMLQLFDKMCRSHKRPDGVEPKPTDSMGDRHNRLLWAVGDAVCHLQN